MLFRTVVKVKSIASERTGIQEIIIDLDGVEYQAVCYPDLTGKVTPGDEVLLNTTAVNLGLGTGGVHFVIANLTNPVQATETTPGHIMKLRYTPFQESVLAVEEDASPDQQSIRDFESLGGMPVVCCELHSQIAPVAAAIRAAESVRDSGLPAPNSSHRRIVYVMTDGAALPISFSRLVSELKEKGLIDVTITCGQALGGDIEAVNLYTALIAAKQVAHADIVIVCQGPGNAGTGTKFGFSGIQQGEALNTVGILGGTPIAAVRMSFADARERHIGVSHHTITVLSSVALTPVQVALPKLPEEQAVLVNVQITPSVVRHRVWILDGKPGLDELARKSIRVKTMGRSVRHDREFFLAASAAGALAAEFAEKKV